MKIFPYLALLLAFGFTPVCARAVKDTLIVDARGKGDCRTIEEALSKAEDSPERHVTILVRPGVYRPAPKLNGKAPYKESYRNLSLVGTDRDKCVLKGNCGYYFWQEKTDFSLIRLSGNVRIANLTMIHTSDSYLRTAKKQKWDLSKPHNRAYCCHVDAGRRNGDVVVIENCIMHNDHFSCIGWGLRQNTVLRIKDCVCICDVDKTRNAQSGFENYGTLYGHLAAGRSRCTGQRLEIIGCRIENSRYPTAINQMDASGAKDYSGISASLYLKDNTCITTDTSKAFKKVSIKGQPQVAELDPMSSGNNVPSMNSEISNFVKTPSL